MNRKTKIVATVGPQRKLGENNQTTELGEFNKDGKIPHEQLLEKFIEAGVDIIRMNMSFASNEKPYGNNEKKYLSWLNENTKGIAKKIGVLGDLPGPKVRLKDVNLQGRELIAKGDHFFLGFGEAPPPMGEIGAGVYVNDQPFNTMIKKINGEEKFSAYAEGLTRPALLSIGDGKVEMQVEELLDDEIVRCKILSDIVYETDIPSGKGLTIKQATLEFNDFGESDKQALDFLLENGGGILAYIAVSFAQSQQDILLVRDHIEKHSAINELFEKSKKDNPYITKKILAPGIIAKIETQQAIDNIDEILDIADGVMVARGDLGEQIPREDVPRIQKELIRKCNTRGKVVITATQMLDSMEKKQSPTRAEAADVFNAIMDGTDAVMLSGETSTGAHPIRAIETMATIAASAEQYYFSMKNQHRFEQVVLESSMLIDDATRRLKEEANRAREMSSITLQDRDFFDWKAELISRKIKSSEKQWTTDTICKAACELSEVHKDDQSSQLVVHRETINRESKPILIPSTSGRTVIMVSRFRPRGCIIGAAHYESTYRKLLLSFGVRPVWIGVDKKESDQMVQDAINIAIREKFIDEGDEIVTVAGTPPLRPGTTNMIQILVAKKK